jgi:hypothetical protein
MNNKPSLYYVTSKLNLFFKAITSSGKSRNQLLLPLARITQSKILREDDCNNNIAMEYK